MKKRIFLQKPIIVVLLLSAFFCFIKTNAQGVGNYASDRLLAKFIKTPEVISVKNGVVNTGLSGVDILNSKYGCSSVEKLFVGNFKNAAAAAELKLDNIVVINFSSPGSIEKMIEEYMATGLFEYVEPDYIGYQAGVMGNGEVAGTPLLTPNDPYFYLQYGLYNNGTFTDTPSKSGADIKMKQGWDITTGSASIIVGVIDGGSKLDHPEFSGRFWQNTDETAGNGIDDDGNTYIDDTKGGWDFVNKDNDPTDDNGHGTNVSGIICATGNNSNLYAGVNWNSKLIICKGTNSGGTGYYSDWVLAINYCVASGAKVINMSLGGTSSSPTMQTAITNAWQNNVLIVPCMMNANSSTLYYPAACDHVFAVGATNAKDERCNPFIWGGGSSYGSHIKVVAPGNVIYGLHYQSNTNYNYYWSGTSQATPYVTGLASLIFSLNPNLTPDQVMNIIEVTADDQVGLSSEDVAGFDQYYGYGRINAYDALVLTKINAEQSKKEENNLIVYPNPARNVLKINLVLSSASEIKIELKNILGETVYEENLSSTANINKSIDVSSFAKGIYILEINTTKTTLQEKVVIE
ncbi:MAG: S8 family serine peptidase [Bacteroidales bacterium]|nr:S8 family serine peptidase [Bacteroidales bacterium]